MASDQANFEQSFNSETDRFQRELGQLVSGELVLLGDFFEPHDDDFGGGEPAELHPDKEPPGTGGVFIDIGRIALV